MTNAHDNPQALPPGFLLAEYRIERVLGSGGFGITYLAEDTTLHKKLAIKEYLPVDFALRLKLPDVAARSRGAEDDFKWGLERFLDEARTLARFRHPNLVPVLRFFEANGTAYMVMEYERGDTLAELVGELEQAYDETSARALLLPLLDGLNEVHQAGFLHRDIKPGNIVMRPGGVPVLIDFGAARQALVGRSRSMTNIVTPRYAPIEQYGLDQRQGPWSDIYGMAAVMHTMLTGEPPPDAVSRVPEDKYRRLSERRLPGFKPGFLAAIDWGLEVFASDRPQSIAEWRSAIEGAIASPLPQAALTRRVIDTELPSMGPARAADTPALERPAPPVAPTAARSGIPTWILPVAAVAIAAVVAMGYFLDRGTPAGTATTSADQAAVAPPSSEPTPTTTPAPPAPKPPATQSARPATPAPNTVKPDPPKPDAAKPDPGRVTIAEAQGMEAAKAARARAEEAALVAGNVAPAAADAVAQAEQARLRAAEAASVTSLALSAVDLPDGSRYAGELNAGAKQGLGVLISPDGRRYAGQWRQDWPDGRGVMIYADGRRYEGEFHAGKRHGLGVLIARDGSRQEGQWRDDRAQGLGTIVQADGRKLAGQWRDGGLEGLGVAIIGDGQRYEGEWRDGRRAGYGALVTGDGKVQAGQWQNDALANAP